MSKVILVPINQLNLEYVRNVFKKAKADAREHKAVSTVEGGKQDDSKTA